MILPVNNSRTLMCEAIILLVQKTNQAPLLSSATLAVSDYSQKRIHSRPVR